MLPPLFTDIYYFLKIKSQKELKKINRNEEKKCRQIRIIGGKKKKKTSQNTIQLNIKKRIKNIKMKTTQCSLKL